MGSPYRSSAAWAAAHADRPPTAVAIGNFDGVHAGHRAVLETLLARARATGSLAVAYTFDPAPTAVLAPARHQPRILRVDDRVRLLLAAGVDAVVVEPFTREYAARPAAWFAEHVLGEALNARTVVVGYDFRFGAGRTGDAGTLRALLPEADVVAIDPRSADGAPVSSSRIRKLVARGEVAEAAALLGRPHRLAGVVVRGDARGRTLGFPTANLANEVELTPADGVYAVRVYGAGPAPRDGVMNIGTRPTVNGSDRRFEVHVFDFAGDLYDAPLEVELIAHIRGEQRFASLDALKAGIAADAARARELLR